MVSLVAIGQEAAIGALAVLVFMESRDLLLNGLRAPADRQVEQLAVLRPW